NEPVLSVTESAGFLFLKRNYQFLFIKPLISIISLKYTYLYICDDSVGLFYKIQKVYQQPVCLSWRKGCFRSNDSCPGFIQYGAAGNHGYSSPGSCNDKFCRFSRAPASPAKWNADKHWSECNNITGFGAYKK